jgi:glutathione-regulated potassium-efflux system ancillary protein KefF
VIVVIHAHPYPSRSRACAALLEAIRDVPAIDIRSLYTLYPDFDIDARAEQQALERASLVVWLHPLYWYSVPALMKHWFDSVLVGGWAHGKGAALKGKHCLWVTTSSDADAYRVEGRHGHPFEAFVPVVEQVARYCGMHWLEPYIVHGGHALADGELSGHGRKLRARVDAWNAKHRARTG